MGLIAALFSFEAVHDRGVAINPHRHCIQLERLEFERPGIQVRIGLPFGDERAFRISEHPVTSDNAVDGRLGKDTSGQYRFTDVFLKRDGRWHAIATHVTRVVKQ